LPAANGADALTACERTRYDFILADIHMPHMDGHEFTGRLRNAEAARNDARTPIIAVTADAMIGEEERCLVNGMDASLAKPVSIEQLRATLERFLRIRLEIMSRVRPRRQNPLPRSTVAYLRAGWATIRTPWISC